MHDEVDFFKRNEGVHETRIDEGLYFSFANKSEADVRKVKRVSTKHIPTKRKSVQEQRKNGIQNREGSRDEDRVNNATMTKMNMPDEADDDLDET